MKRQSPASNMRLRVVLAGDRRLAENVILEVRALAQRIGLSVPRIKVVSRTASGAKARRRRSPKPRAGS